MLLHLPLWLFVIPVMFDGDGSANLTGSQVAVLEVLSNFIASQIAFAHIAKPAILVYIKIATYNNAL